MKAAHPLAALKEEKKNPSRLERDYGPLTVKCRLFF